MRFFTITYNQARQVLTVRDARDKLTVNEYDAAGTNLVKTTDPLNNKTTFTYSLITGQRTTMKMRWTMKPGMTTTPPGAYRPRRIHSANHHPRLRHE